MTLEDSLMPFAIRGELVGLQQVLGTLGQLRRQTDRSKILRKAANVISQPITKTAKQLAPKEAGLFRKSIGRKVVVSRSKGGVVIIIGPRVGFRQQVTVKKDKVYRQRKGRTVRIRKPGPAYLSMIRDPVKYAHLVELGTVKHPPKASLRPAFDRHKRWAANEATRIIREGIAEVIAKAVAKGKRP